ncbi:hypothetical protein PRK78_000792 [Emydomyces testavorans]|uniref:Major facilitator superfamily (MFS) profile domain-containing protein n=1 Tax=Emydomyces testavorans TaxID=2070801 RepID=A0AAF0IFZ7_9EURO|nr:hypothetical protein PRK78_000792 [Emydomyces testavorans]
MSSAERDPEPPIESRRNVSTISSADADPEKTLEITQERALTALTPQISAASKHSHSSLAQRATSVATAGTTDPNFEVDWEADDPENPRNWSLAYKGMVIGFLSWNTWAIVLYSTSYTAGLAELAREFHTSATVVTLGLTLYLLGLAVGSVLLAPLSEMYGRKPVAVISLLAFILLIIPCGIGDSMVEVLVVRFFGAIAGSAMISSAPGCVADIVDDDRRALALSIWSIGPLNGPVFGPLIGGLVTQYLGWRWTNWIMLMFAGVALVFSCIIKETYAPVLLQKKAARMRNEKGDPRCIFWNIYISLVYAILYLCFVAYPIVFCQIRGWSTGMSGMAFIGIGIGGLMVVFLEPLIRKMINSHEIDPETGKVGPEAMVSVVCISAILAPVGEMWFAWTCVPTSVHWILPILAGIPFGAGNTGVFIYACNYLTYSYGVYAASAMAGNAVMRSIIGGVFPLIGPHMYQRLGAHWAGTLLASLEVLIIPIPFVFYRYGYKIRMKSTLIRAMQEDKKKLDGKKTKANLSGKEHSVTVLEEKKEEV